MINKFQAGGQAQDAQTQQFMQYIAQEAAQKGFEIKTEEDLARYLVEDAASKGIQIQSQDQLKQYLAQKYQEVMATGQMAKLGAKINYIKKLKGSCPEGEEMIFFKKGGKVCKVCQGKKMEKGGQTKKENEVQNFKNSRKKLQFGGNTPKKNYTLDGGKAWEFMDRPSLKYRNEPAQAVRNPSGNIEMARIFPYEGDTVMIHPFVGDKTHPDFRKFMDKFNGIVKNVEDQALQESEKLGNNKSPYFDSPTGIYNFRRK